MTSKEWRFEGYSKNKKLFKAMFRENKQTRIILMLTQLKKSRTI